MAKLRIAGVIIPNDYKWFYDYFEEESTCPADVQQAIDTASGEELEVEINSPGGEIASGSEIYTMLRRYGNVRITVTGEACSAASIIAMAGHCEMSPTSLMMVHRVSTRAEGNCNTMDKASEMLRAADEALSSAYCAKSGMSQDEALSMMDAETWITPQRALELKLIDGILFEDERLLMTASLFRLPTQEQMEAVRRVRDGTGTPQAEDTKLMAAKARQRYLNLKEDKS